MISFLDIVQQFSSWSGVRLNVARCKIPAYIHAIQTISRKRDRDDALRAMLSHVTVSSRPIGSLTQDKSLPGGYLGTSFTASLSPEGHLRWTKAQITQIGKTLGRTPLPSTLRNTSYYMERTPKSPAFIGLWLPPPPSGSLTWRW